MKILAFMKYGDLAASTRQRLMIYEPYLAKAGFQIEYQPLLESDHIRRLERGRRAAIGSTAWAYLKRLWLLVTRRDHDVVWVHYELFPYLPAFTERLSRLGAKPVVVDYDDATFETYAASPNRIIRAVLGRKLAPLLRGAAACLCGNAYLRDYALRYQPHSIVLPTVVDTTAYVPAERPPSRRVTVGWIGSPSTWVLVRPYLGLLGELCRTLGVEVRVVGAGAGAESDRFPGLKLIEWTRDCEVGEIQQMDIGIMPVWDGPFQRGKCGYKLIQYMACGLPVVASPIGVNSEIVSDGKNGYLASSVEEWREALTKLIRDADLRRRLGAAGRRTVEQHYSLEVHAPRLVDTIRSVVASR